MRVPRSQLAHVRTSRPGRAAERRSIKAGGDKNGGEERGERRVDGEGVMQVTRQDGREWGGGTDWFDPGASQQRLALHYCTHPVSRAPTWVQVIVHLL
eukprot:744177-Hanusia_phi.AAC.4